MVKKESYDQMIDIWALGILAYELLVGKVPFNIWS
jgi:serine/threonine protein kinase